MVFINENMDHMDAISNALKKMDISQIELLLAHNLAYSKYKNMGINNHDYSADFGLMQLFIYGLNQNGIKASYLKW